MGFGKRCELYTRMDYRHVSRDTTSAEEQRQTREKDKEDFLRSFRPRWAWSGYGDDWEKGEALEFIKEHRLDLLVIFPSDRNDPVEILKQAVRRDRLIVVIGRRSYGGGGGGLIPPPQQAGRTVSDRQYAQLAVKAFSYIPPAFDPEPLAFDNEDTGTPLGDAQPFELGDDVSSGDVMDIAARGVSEADEAKCFAQYERDMDLCNALGSPMGGARGAALCKQQAFANYQQCRGL
jgi:hypothetical protein